MTVISTRALRCSLVVFPSCRRCPDATHAVLDRRACLAWLSAVSFINCSIMREFQYSNLRGCHITVQTGMDVNRKCRDSSMHGSGNMFTRDDGESYLSICSDWKSWTKDNVALSSAYKQDHTLDNVPTLMWRGQRAAVVTVLSVHPTYRQRSNYYHSYRVRTPPHAFNTTLRVWLPVTGNAWWIHATHSTYFAPIGMWRDARLRPVTLTSLQILGSNDAPYASNSRQPRRLDLPPVSHPRHKTHSWLMFLRNGIYPSASEFRPPVTRWRSGHSIPGYCCTLCVPV